MQEVPPFAYGPNGKPFLKDHPGIHFNLSHCPRAALCVVADHPVGCDIEAVPEKLDLDLCHHCFNDKEVAAILASDSPTLTLTTLWTQKEALLKLTGEGLTAMSQLSTLHFPLSTFHSPDCSYVYTACSPA